MKPLIPGLTATELETLVQDEGFPPFRGRQAAESLYLNHVSSFDDMKNIPAALRSKLTEKYDISIGKVITTLHSQDSTAKLLIELRDGLRVETVGLPYPDRFSCCISTQVGCSIGCLFCASGKDGFVRNLEAGEIIGQVFAIRELIRQGKILTTEKNRRIDHIVFMGMGEPLLNYDATVKTIHLLNSEMGIAARNITVSTAGIVPGIQRLADEHLQITLAVSLHAPNDTLRKKLVPGITAWSVADIMNASREYFQKTGRRVSFEYCMLDGVNDGEKEARELTVLLARLNCHVNLIRFNTVSGSTFKPSSPERLTVFRSILEEAGIQVTQRFERGTGIDAACGQLRQVMSTPR
jgi:23S rRNA (adenine2503-C2)-methyltransferase